MERYLVESSNITQSITSLQSLVAQAVVQKKALDEIFQSTETMQDSDDGRINKSDSLALAMSIVQKKIFTKIYSLFYTSSYEFIRLYQHTNLLPLTSRFQTATIYDKSFIKYLQSRQNISSDSFQEHIQLFWALHGVDVPSLQAPQDTGQHIGQGIGQHSGQDTLHDLGFDFSHTTKVILYCGQLGAMISYALVKNLLQPAIDVDIISEVGLAQRYQWKVMRDAECHHFESWKMLSDPRQQRLGLEEEITSLQSPIKQLYTPKVRSFGLSTTPNKRVCYSFLQDYEPLLDEFVDPFLGTALPSIVKSHLCARFFSHKKILARNFFRLGKRKFADTIRLADAFARLDKSSDPRHIALYSFFDSLHDYRIENCYDEREIFIQTGNHSDNSHLHHIMKHKKHMKWYTPEHLCANTFYNVLASEFVGYILRNNLPEYAAEAYLSIATQMDDIRGVDAVLYIPSYNTLLLIDFSTSEKENFAALAEQKDHKLKILDILPHLRSVYDVASVDVAYSNIVIPVDDLFSFSDILVSSGLHKNMNNISSLSKARVTLDTTIASGKAYFSKSSYKDFLQTQQSIVDEIENSLNNTQPISTIFLEE